MVYWFFVGLMVGATVCGLIAGILVLVAVTRRREKRANSLSAITPRPPCAGPILRLNFVESLDPLLFSHAVEEEALAYAAVHLPYLFGDATTLTLETLRIAAARSEMVVSASSGAIKGATKILRHKASGRKLPFLAHRSGRMTEVMKEVGRGRKLLGGAAAASAIVVSLAHMIATADLAKNLKLVNKKIDLLIAYRRIDQTASLERIYTAARELLSEPLNEVRAIEIWRLRGELRQLRTTWRLEFEQNLLGIDDPSKAPWIDKMFASQSSSDKKIVGELSTGQLQIMMIEYSLRLERVLAIASGSLDSSDVTLSGELNSIEGLGILLGTKVGFISEQRRGSAQPMVEQIADTVLAYRATLQAPTKLLELTDSSSEIGY